MGRSVFMREGRGAAKENDKYCEFVHVREQGRSFRASPLFAGCHCCSELVISGGQGVLFFSAWSIHQVFSLVVPMSFWTPSGMAGSGHTSLPWLRGSPYYGIVPETEKTKRTSSGSISKLNCVNNWADIMTYKLPYCAAVSLLMLCCFFSSSIMFRSCLSVWKVSLGSWMVNLEYSSCSRWGPWYTAMLAHASVK